MYRYLETRDWIQRRSNTSTGSNVGQLSPVANSWNINRKLRRLLCTRWRWWRPADPVDKANWSVSWIRQREYSKYGQYGEYGVGSACASWLCFISARLAYRCAFTEADTTRRVEVAVEEAMFASLGSKQPAIYPSIWEKWWRIIGLGGTSFQTSPCNYSIYANKNKGHYKWRNTTWYNGKNYVCGDMWCMCACNVCIL